MDRAYLDSLKTRMKSFRHFFKQLCAPVFSFVFLQIHLSLDAFFPFPLFKTEPYNQESWCKTKCSQGLGWTRMTFILKIVGNY